MADGDLANAIRARLRAAGVDVAENMYETLTRYLALLARWNRRINLTAFDLDRPTDHAIDRLIVEPVAAAAAVRTSDRVAVDVGSGGGSPALPLKIACPDLQMTLIEARVRKSAFLREAVRELGLRDVTVETARLERTGLDRLNGHVDVVTMRAVRSDDDVLAGIGELLRSGGRLFWFHEAGGDDTLRPEWLESEPSEGLRQLRVFRRR